MRNIKFRAWDKGDKSMKPILSINFENKEVIHNELHTYDGEGDETDWSTFKDIELMQYIGLKDKNNVEIYEGDIVNFRTNDYRHLISEIKWGNCIYLIKSDYGVWEGLWEQDASQIEVIGNIYKNPEMLK